MLFQLQSADEEGYDALEDIVHLRAGSRSVGEGLVGTHPHSIHAGDSGRSRGATLVVEGSDGGIEDEWGGAEWFGECL